MLQAFGGRRALCTPTRLCVSFPSRLQTNKVLLKKYAVPTCPQLVFPLNVMCCCPFTLPAGTTSAELMEITKQDGTFSQSHRRLL